MARAKENFRVRVQIPHSVLFRLRELWGTPESLEEKEAFRSQVAEMLLTGLVKELTKSEIKNNKLKKELKI